MIPASSTKSSSRSILSISAILTLLGLIFISISSLAEASSAFNDKFYFIKKQSLWLLIGLVVFYLSAKIKISTLKNISSLLYLTSLAFLILVLIPQIGTQSFGARRWLDLGIIGIQPVEILKFTAIIYFSHLFSQTKKRNIKTLIVHLSLPFFLIIIQPNLSSAILVSAIAISIYYLSGADILPLLIFCFLAVSLSTLLIFTSDYRRQRFETLVSPQKNEQSSYHHQQIIYALGSGGLLGKGFGSSDQKYRFIPKISTDSILAVVGEETGFVGLFAIFCLYLSLISQLFSLSHRLTDQFLSLVVAGIACWIAYQSLINIGAIVALIPLTGVPLPFISYGGSSLVSLLAAIGIVHNINKHSS